MTKLEAYIAKVALCCTDVAKYPPCLPLLFNAHSAQILSVLQRATRTTHIQCFLQHSM